MVYGGLGAGTVRTEALSSSTPTPTSYPTIPSPIPLSRTTPFPSISLLFGVVPGGHIDCYEPIDHVGWKFKIFLYLSQHPIVWSNTPNCYRVTFTLRL